MAILNNMFGVLLEKFAANLASKEMSKTALKNSTLLSYIQKVAPERLAPVAKDLKNMAANAYFPPASMRDYIKGETKVQGTLRHISKGLK